MAGSISWSRNNTGPTTIYRSSAAANAAPTAPGGIVSAVHGKRVSLSWNAASDDRTPAASLTYNLRVGTAPGAQNVMTANADLATGRRRLTGMGNVQLARTRHLDLPAGTYYWSVQAVDGRFTGGPFSSEGTFTIPVQTAANCGPGNALQLDGVDDYVSVAHNAALNRYPITITAWIKTSRNAAQVDGIVSKYIDASSNGYSLLLYSGRVFAWYVRDGVNQVFRPNLGLDGGFVADNQWHHLAFSVDASGGKFYVDGILRESLAWNGTPGATTTTTPLQIGKYSTYPNSFLGNIDEVTLWNYALSTTEINDLLPRRLSDFTPGLVAHWTFNESSGTTAFDNTGGGYDGTLLGGVARVASGAAICAPIVRTLPVPSGYANGIIAEGEVNPQGFTATAWFEYGTGTSYGSSTAPVSIGSANNWSDVTQSISGLTPGVTYHFRAVAQNQFGRLNGQDQTFTTGSSSFSGSATFYLQSDFADLVFADFTSNGYLDLVQSGDSINQYNFSFGPLTLGCRDVWFNTYANWINEPGLYRGALAAGDFNNDGRVDLFVSGLDKNNAPQSLLRQNTITDPNADPWTFNDVSSSIPGLSDGAAAWGDFDNDGDLDLAVSGVSGTTRYLRIYRNDGGNLNAIGADLPGVSTGSLAWADFDADGYPDLLICGTDTGADAGAATRLWRNLGGAGSAFLEAAASLTGVTEGDIAWGDYNGNGALDLAISGRSAGGAKVTKIYSNLSVPNRAPSAPGNLASNVQCDRVLLSWSAASDPETPAAALTYNLRVGTTPGGIEIMSPQANLTTGARRVVEMGNVQLGTTAWLRLPPGTYYWSVQAVDGTYAGSPFAPEQSFTVINDPRPRITAIARPAPNQFRLRFTGCPGIAFVVQRSDDLALWADLGAAMETAPGVFEFTDPSAFTLPRRFYRARFP